MEAEREDFINPNISPPVAPHITAPHPHSDPTPGNSQGQSGGERHTYASIIRSSVTKQLFRASATNKNKDLATEIWHRTINSGAVVFNFDNTSMASNDKVLEVLGKTYGKEAIKGIKPLYRKHHYEVLFSKATSSMLRHQATHVGIKVDDTVVKAQDTYSLSAKLTKVKLREIPLYPENDDLVRVLRDTMSAFGEVKNVSIYETKSANGEYQFFQGEGFVLLDTQDKPGKTYSLLNPFIL
jgi:hypothetical protein